MLKKLPNNLRRISKNFETGVIKGEIYKKKNKIIIHFQKNFEQIQENFFAEVGNFRIQKKKL